MTDDLPTGVWVDAHLARLSARGAFFTVVRKGDPSRGTVMLKLFAARDRCKIVQQERNWDDEDRMGWVTLFRGAVVPESTADDHIDGALAQDPDLWVIEIEDGALENPFDL